MQKELYGEKYNEHLLEQYKLYVGMADQVSTRRINTNQFYISLLSGLFAFLTFIVSRENFINILDIISMAISLIGILLCIVWRTNINSYKQLNKLKFIVIHEIENMLPFACYDREWQIEKENKHKYTRLTLVENYVPVIMAIPYLILLTYSFFHLIK